MLRVVRLAIHAIAIASCTSILLSAACKQTSKLLCSETQYMGQLYLDSIISDFMHTGQYSALPCDVALVKIMTPRVKYTYWGMKGLALRRTEK